MPRCSVVCGCGLRLGEICLHSCLDSLPLGTPQSPNAFTGRRPGSVAVLMRWDTRQAKLFIFCSAWDRFLRSKACKVVVCGCAAAKKKGKQLLAVQRRLEKKTETLQSEAWKEFSIWNNKTRKRRGNLLHCWFPLKKLDLDSWDRARVTHVWRWPGVTWVFH